MRLIDADPLLRCIPSEEHVSKFAVANAPTIDAVPVRHGKWIPKEIIVHNYYAITGFKCSVCGKDALDDVAEPTTDYCPHCGARMDAE